MYNIYLFYVNISFILESYKMKAIRWKLTFARKCGVCRKNATQQRKNATRKRTTGDAQDRTRTQRNHSDYHIKRKNLSYQHKQYNNTDHI